MKKFLIALLLSFSCAFTVAAVSCGDKDSDSESSESSSRPASKESYALHFTAGEGYDYVSETIVTDGNPVMKDTLDNEKAKEGSTVSFALDLGAFYRAENGEPSVFVNGSAIASEDGVYSFTVEGESTVTVGGIVKDRSEMLGDGSFSNPFTVSRPVDLVYIAERVNAGDLTYVNGAYVLVNDIDCKGEELQVIGNGRGENAYFSGSFTANPSPDTNETVRYTISNFVINSDDSNYVGLFGTVFVNPAVQSSALFYGVCLKDYQINVSLKNPPLQENLTISCGSLIGFANGANIYMCDAQNGKITIDSDNLYFSYAGGLIGFQGATYNDFGSFASEIAYCAVDADINVLSGSVLYAGGIAGYTASNYPLTQSFIHNSYANGDVYGAMRAGGIVGGLGQYTSVSNCYATGDITARVNLEPDSVAASMEEFLYAYAGGLAGYAENDTIVNDSFFAGTTKAFTKSNDARYSRTAAAAAGGDAAAFASAVSQKYIVWKCYDGNDLDFSKIATVKNKLKWDSCDWIFTNNAYPEINYEPASTTFSTTLTVHYVTKATDAQNRPVVIEVDGKTKTEQKYFDSADNTYAPISEAFASGGLPFYYQASNGYLSYGYFLDEDCTLRVPYAYLSTTNVVFYVGFADATPILGTYGIFLKENTKSITLTLNADGTADYVDGSTKDTSNFLYDGESLVIEGARLARYYDGAYDGELDMDRYFYYDFKATLENDGLRLYDGTYFTQSDPLIAIKDLFVGEYYTADGKYYTFYGKDGEVETESGILKFTYTYSVSDKALLLTYKDQTTEKVAVDSLRSYDPFRGLWVKAATVNKTFAFDGEGGWEASDGSSGDYTVNDDDTLSFTYGGTQYTVKFDKDSKFLTIVDAQKTQTYYAEGSYKGVWVNGKGREVLLMLNGLDRYGNGTARVEYASGVSYDLTYEHSETDGYSCLYMDGLIFGYFTYDESANRLNATLYTPDQTEQYTKYSLLLVDDYDGVWISNNDAFNTLQFSGLGMYNGEGFLTVTDLTEGKEEQVEVSYTLKNNTLQGSFTYKNVSYTLTFDEDEKSVTIRANGQSDTLLQRKDRFADKTFIDETGATYVFDGKGALDNGGKVTVTLPDSTSAVYAYKALDDGSYSVSDNGADYGKITVEDGYYQLTIFGATQAENVIRNLYIQNDLMGTWAIGGQFAALEIGATDTNGLINATFKGIAVQLRYLDPTMLTFRYVDGNHPYTYYLHLYPDYDTILLSEYLTVYGGDYSICSRADKMFGSWIKETTHTEGGYTIRTQDKFTFDGVQSRLSANGGIVIRSYSEWEIVNGKERLLFETETEYYYLIKEGGIVLWSQKELGGKTLYYKIELGENGAYKNGDNGNLTFDRTEVDSLYLTRATDKSTGITYVFDGMNVGGKAGTVTDSDGKEYEYKITAFNTNKTATILFTEKDGGKTYTATLDYSKQAEITITLTEA